MMISGLCVFKAYYRVISTWFSYSFQLHHCQSSILHRISEIYIFLLFLSFFVNEVISA